MTGTENDDLPASVKYCKAADSLHRLIPDFTRYKAEYTLAQMQSP